MAPPWTKLLERTSQMVDEMPNLCSARARLRPERPAPMMATWVGGEDGILQGSARLFL